MSLSRVVAAGAVGSLLLVGGVACSDDDSSTAESTTTTEAGRQSFQFQTDDGQVSVSLDGQLPPGWPSDFPVPDGAEAAGSGSLGGSDTTYMIAVFSTSETPEDAFAFYTGSSDLTIESQSSLGSGSTYIGTAALGGDWDGRVTVAPKDGETLIVVALQTAGASTSDTATDDTASSGAVAG